MEKLLFLTCVRSLLTTTGCLIAEGGRHGHGRHGHGRHGNPSAVIAPGPVVVVPVVPVVRVL